MIEPIKNIFSIPDLRKRVIFTFLMLAVYRKTSNCKLMMVAALVAAILALLVVAILKHF